MMFKNQTDKIEFTLKTSNGVGSGVGSLMMAVGLCFSAEWFPAPTMQPQPATTQSTNAILSPSCVMSS